MDLVQFAEEVLGLKLYSYQKSILKGLEKMDKIYYPYTMRNLDRIGCEWAKGIGGVKSGMVIYEEFMGEKEEDDG